MRLRKRLGPNLAGLQGPCVGLGGSILRAMDSD